MRWPRPVTLAGGPYLHDENMTGLAGESPGETPWARHRLRAMRLYGVSCLNSIGRSNVYKGGGGAFTWFAPTSPVCRVLGPLGRAPRIWTGGRRFLPAAGHHDAGGGGLRAWSPVTAG